MLAHVPAANLEQALHYAWDRRQLLHDDPDIDVYRIFHGFSEGRADLDIEKFGPVARVVWKSERELETDVHNENGVQAQEDQGGPSKGVERFGPSAARFKK